jgi:hypothetical protein
LGGERDNYLCNVGNGMMFPTTACSAVPGDAVEDEGVGTEAQPCCSISDRMSARFRTRESCFGGRALGRFIRCGNAALISGRRSSRKTKNRMFDHNFSDASLSVKHATLFAAWLRWVFHAFSALH